MQIDWGLVMAALAAVGGAALTTFGGYLQQRWSAKERTRERDEARADKVTERHLDLRRAELERVRTLYRRVIEIAMEYRDLEGSANPDWKTFKPRFNEVRAALAIDGDSDVKDAFHKYIDDVQASEDEAQRLGYVAEFWEHYDQALDKLADVMRVKLAERDLTKPNT